MDLVEAESLNRGDKDTGQFLAASSEGRRGGMVVDSATETLEVHWSQGGKRKTVSPLWSRPPIRGSRPSRQVRRLDFSQETGLLPQTGTPGSRT
jgi:hypothetical protein